MNKRVSNLTLLGLGLAGPELTQFSLLGALQCDHRDRAFGLLLISGELRELRCVLGIELVALLALDLFSSCLKSLVANFDGYFGIRQQVMIPGRVAGRSALRGEYQYAVPVR